MLETTDETLLAYTPAAAHEAGLGLVVIGRHCLRTMVLPMGEALVIGRHPDCDISLPEPGLSRCHARFVRHAESVTVQDLGSRNGTWLAGKRIDSAPLRVGTSVRLADVVVTVSPWAFLRGHTSQATASEPGPTDSEADAWRAAETLRARLAMLEREEARRALARTGGNQRRAAELLGMPLRTLERRLRMWRAQDTETPRSSSDEAGLATPRN